MKITIDTTKDSKSEIRGIITFLNSHVLHSPDEISNPEFQSKESNPKTFSTQKEKDPASQIDMSDMISMCDTSDDFKEKTTSNQKSNSSETKLTFESVEPKTSSKKPQHDDYVDMSLVNNILEGNRYNKDQDKKKDNKKENVYFSEKIEIIPF